MRETKELLLSRGIKPSIQRIAVMKYLNEHRVHPTVDDIYNDLHCSLPTLSKTTIYNTLTLFVNAGAALAITIDKNNVRYDANTEQHVHFKCSVCGKIFDFEKPNFNINVPKGFIVNEVELYYLGKCSDCEKKSNTKNNN